MLIAAQDINIAITGKCKTIVTLDLQLYAKCMQMRENQFIKDNFVFRLGELHTVFAFLKVIGKYMNGSGIDRLLTEADIYNQPAIDQIIDGNHMKRAIEAHMIIYLALWRVLLDRFFVEFPNESQQMKEQVDGIVNYSLDKITKSSFEKSVTALSANGSFFESLKSFDDGLSQQSLYLRKFMKMFELLLQFIRANRQEDWELHLTTLNAMIPYFFAHDQLNYARLSPLYLATTYDLQHNDHESWNYLKNNFSINKSGITFCSLGSDHALEQENRTLKVLGGIKGLGQNPCALYRICLIAPSLNDISNAFCEEFNIKTSSKEAHYQLTGCLLYTSPSPRDS